LAIILLASFGCGYKLINYSEPIENLGSVAVQTFENESYEPGVEFVVADSLRREFLRRGAVVLVDDAIDADLVVSGVVEPIVTRARSFSSIALALEWEVTLQLAVYAQWSDGTRTRLDENATLATERYLASADIEVTRQNRDEAIRTMASGLAAHVHDMLYELYLP
jgi:hypothetical protein